MKLLMISGDRSILQGKKGAFWYTLEELSKHWERIDVICPKAEIQNTKFKTNSNFEFPNVFFHASSRGLWYQPWWILIKGDELIKEHHHNVMTVHEYPPFYNGLGARWLHRSKKIPYMTEIHHVVGYPKASSLTERIGYMLSTLWLPRWGTNWAKKIRVVSEETRSLLLQWDVPEEKIQLIPSLYLDHAALKADLSIPKKYDVVSAGRLASNKGIEELLWAIARLPTATLLMIGDGTERKRLELLARKLGIGSRVTFAGWLPSNTDVYRAMQSARMFVMNSTSEGGPRVLFEAMALGMPVITTRVGLVSTFVNDGENGIITTGELENLREHIDRLLSDTELRRRIGHNAMATSAKFERSAAIRAYADSLKSVCVS